MPCSDPIFVHPLLGADDAWSGFRIEFAPGRASLEALSRLRASPQFEAIDKRPAEVKAAVVKVFPNVDSRTLDVLFASESLAWKARPLTAADIAHAIAYTKLSGIALPQLDGADPASMIWP